MRPTLFLFISVLTMCSHAQTTLIPDPVFEQFLIDSGIDSGVPDGSVPTSNINSITSLDIWNLTISDLSGIEDFSSLTLLECTYTLLSKIDLSQNLSLSIIDVSHNELDTLILPPSASLTYLNCGMNELTELDVTQCPNLELVYCIHNSLMHLDLSQNSQLNSLQTYNNPLECLNVKNGNNLNMISFGGGMHPNLSCIEVDDPQWSTANWQTNLGTPIQYSTNCGNACSSSSIGIAETPPNTKVLLKIIDTMGNETQPKKNKLLIYLYSDGSTEKKYHF